MRLVTKPMEMMRSAGSLSTRRWSRVSPTASSMISLSDPRARAASIASSAPGSSRSTPGIRVVTPLPGGVRLVTYMEHTGLVVTNYVF
jgi:hypothetical protein